MELRFRAIEIDLQLRGFDPFRAQPAHNLSRRRANLPIRLRGRHSSSHAQNRADPPVGFPQSHPMPARPDRRSLPLGRPGNLRAKQSPACRDSRAHRARPPLPAHPAPVATLNSPKAATLRCAQFHKGLPPILPLVLSQVEGGWRVSTQFADLVLWPEGLRDSLEAYQPRFEHLMIDLATTETRQIQGNPEVRLVQSLLKAAMERQLLEWLIFAEPLLCLAESREFLEALFFYVANAESNLDLQQFAARIDSAKHPNAAAVIMSIAERIRIESRQEGRQVGREEGLQKGREEGLLQGELIGEIRALQRVLKRAQTPPEVLEQLTPEQLRSTVTDLEREIP